MKHLFKNSDYILLALCMSLCLIGVVAIYSAGYNSDDTTEYLKQLIWIGIGIVVMFVVWLIDYKSLSVLAIPGYVIFVGLLVAVLFTEPVNNATSWFDFNFFKFQPSELMKIVYILLLAVFIDYFTKKNKKIINKWYFLGLVLVIFLIPFLLILRQPDMGTAATFLVITFVMLFKAKLSYKYIVALTLILIISLPLIYMFVLTDGQQARINSLFNPELDPLNTGYNAIQSKIAIGSGKWFGMGLLSGTQTQFGYLPVKSSDFIFSVISEELGFVFSFIVVAIYAYMIIRVINISKDANDILGSTIAAGIAGMFMFHLIENIGMTIGLMPITGIPLLFVSYGGTSILTSFIALGLLLSISGRKQNKFFS